MKAFIFAMIFFSAQVFAWGPTGHRVVGEIAQDYLSATAFTKINQILGHQSLSRVSTWPDEIKSEPETYSHTYNWHFTDWSDDAHEHDETNSQGKLLSSIKEQVDVLKNPAATLPSKNFALKFIVHLIGDLHQPLHVGNGLDQGGNFCKVLFHGKEMSLHALWDEGMIDFTKLSFTELTRYVSQGRTQEDRNNWRKGSVIDWALESKNIRAELYPADAERYCRRDIPVGVAEMPKLGYAYSYKFVPVIEKRLYQAGLRLAVVLNEALK